MKKTIMLIFIIIILLSLTGCAEVNYEIKVNQDGSGEISYIYGISKEQMGGIADIVKEVSEPMKQQAEESGYEVEIYENDEISGFKANKYIENLSKDFSLEEAFGEEYVKDTDNNKINIEKGFWTTKYSQNAELDLTKLNDANVRMTYKLKLPTQVKTHNANIVSENGKELTWNLKSGEINKIEFIATQINILPIVIIVVLIIVTVIVVFIVLKKKHVTKKEN